jgi:hypothetical protein
MVLRRKISGTFSTKDAALLVRELMIKFGTAGMNTVCILEAGDVGCYGA